MLNILWYPTVADTSLYWLYQSLSLASKMRLCIEYLNDRKFSNIKIVCACALKSDKTSFIGTHCSTICWERVGVQFFWPTLYININNNTDALKVNMTHFILKLQKVTKTGIIKIASNYNIIRYKNTQHYAMIAKAVNRWYGLKTDTRLKRQAINLK